MTDNTRFDHLFRSWLDQTSTVGEKEELLGLVLKTENDERLRELMDKAWIDLVPQYHLSAEKADLIYNNILNTGSRIVFMPRRRLWMRWVAVAVLVGILASGYWFFIQKRSGTGSGDPLIVKKDVEAPKLAHAVITLADGTQIILDSIGNGTVATQENVSVIKTSDGQISYEASG